MTGLSGNLGGLSEADFPVAGARFECHFCMFVLGWAEFVPPCPRVSVPCLDFVAKHPPLMGTGIQACIGFFTCFLYIGIASFPFFFILFFSSGLLVACRNAGLRACSRGPLRWKLARFSRRNLKNAAELLFPN